MSKKNKKSHAGMIVILVILVLAVAGGTAFYLYQRQQPKKNCRTVPGQHAENGLYHNGIPASEQRSLSP